MKRLIKLNLYLFFLICTLSSNASEQNNQEMKVDSTSQSINFDRTGEIKQLNEKLATLENQIELVDRKYNLRELEVKENILDKYTRWWNPILWIVMTLASITGGLIGYFGIKKNISMKIDEKVMNELEKYLNSSDWTNALKAKIGKQLAEYKFKDSLKILVLSNNSKTEEKIREYFIDNDFQEKNLEFKQGADISIIDNKFDLLFINNMANSFKMETNPINSLIDIINKKRKKLAVFYFSDSGVFFPRDLDKGLNSSYASSFASLYHNLLDLMRYKYLVLDKKDI